MNVNENVRVLMRRLKKEKRINAKIDEILEAVVRGAWYNAFGETSDVRLSAKQMSWIGLQQRIKELWTISREQIPLYCDLNGNASV